MGGGKWSPNTYQTRIKQQRSRGQDSFAYSQGASEVHPSLNPYGIEVRESRDSEEHPNSNAIIIALDVSGSMGRVVRAIHSDLPQLFKLLLGHEYIPHPQILFAAFAHAARNQVPLQVGQFESDNRMDEHLENMIIGGRLAGGGSPGESAEHMFYLAARHTSIDCWEKRQKKGYLFIITDEEASGQVVRKEEVNRFIGPGLKDDVPLDQIITEAAEKYHIFTIIPTGASANASVVEFWKSALGPERVIELDDPEYVSEVMALTIGLTERTITLEEGLQHLQGGAPQKDETQADPKKNLLAKARQILQGDDDSAVDYQRPIGPKLAKLRNTLSLIAGQSVQGSKGIGLADDDDQQPRTRRL
ncbi:MAG: VWA domain-containing protein [Anaerolineae bacterium]|nr:VWA domain-containing protein [Anaerolineae bacterium]